MKLLRGSFRSLLSLAAVVLCLCPSAFGKPEVVLKLGHSLPTSHPVHKAMVFMAERVSELSNGEMEVQIYPSEQLGNEKECIEALQLGYLAMTKVSSAPMESFVNKMKIFGIPYLFRDADHYWKILNGPIGKELLLSGQSKRLRGLCYYDAGARSFYTKDHAIRSPSDLNGLKIRVQNSIMAIKMIQTMGGSATPIPFGELYTSLDQGVVDGAENNAPSFVQARHHEVCKYYALDEHTCLPDILMIGTRSWSRLSAEQQQILQEAADESVDFQRQLWVKAVEADLKVVQDGGVEVIHPDKQPFRDSVRPIWEEFQDSQDEQLAEIGNLINRIQEVE